MLAVTPLTGLPEVRPGDDLSALLGDAIERAGGLEAGDVVVVAQKAVSKAEGRVEETEDVVAAVLREAKTVRRRRGDLIIAETKHGFVCASAGVDRSNAPGEGWIVLLPEDPDASAARLRSALDVRFGTAPGVIVSDSFGRAWRHGTTDVAIGVAGISPSSTCAENRMRAATARLDGDRRRGRAGRRRRARDGEGRRRPCRDRPRLHGSGRRGSARDLVMPPERDLFP